MPRKKLNSRHNFAIFHKPYLQFAEIGGKGNAICIVTDVLHEVMKICVALRKLLPRGMVGLRAKWSMRFLKRAFSTGQDAWRMISLADSRCNDSFHNSIRV